MPSITITLTLEELMQLPGDAVLRLIDKAAPPKEFLQAAHDHEWSPHHGKGRWVVTNHLRKLITQS